MKSKTVICLTNVLTRTLITITLWSILTQCGSTSYFYLSLKLICLKKYLYSIGLCAKNITLKQLHKNVNVQWMQFSNF